MRLMKLYILLILAVIACSPAYSAETDLPAVPTKEQIDKMVAAGWKKSVKSIDITFYRDYRKPPEPLEQLRKKAEEVADKGEYEGRSLDELKPYEIERRNRIIEINYNNWVALQKSYRRTKNRVWISDGMQRIDTVMAEPNELLKPDAAYEMTYVNLGDKSKGTDKSISCYHNLKSMMIQNKQSWAKDTVIDDLGRLPSCFQGILGRLKSLEEFVFVPDANKIEQLQKTGLIANNHRVTVRPDPNNPNKRDRIDIKSDESPLETVIICDRENYSHIYYMEGFNSQSGKPLLIKRCDNFDSQGFPHNATVINYDINGNFDEEKIYRIEKVELNPVIPKNIFEYLPPDDYGITEISPNGENRVIREKGGIEGAMIKHSKAVSEKDIETLVELLKHEIWEVRLRSLQVLEKFLKDDEEGLKNAAILLKNDENPQVRQKANAILSRLNRKGQGRS
ncbi:MAG: hypothetical protein JW806_03900 [Sedimentisphaerales bacterium]|nr:hypothetical protein [Sedimentisphaerales bacterium]